MSSPEAPTREERRFHVAMAIASLALVVFVAAGFSHYGISIQARQVWGVVKVLIAVLGLAAYCRWRKFDSLREGMLVIFWALLLSNLLTLPMYVAARQPFALQDALFARMDRALGLEVPAVLRFMAQHPRIGRLLDISYDLLIPLMALAVVLPAFFRRVEAVKEYVVATLIAAVIAVALFAVLPGIGPWAQYGFAPNAPQRQCMDTLLLLRRGTPFTVDLHYTAGLICFPSFHTILAILSAVALWRLRVLRWIGVVVATLIVISTVTTGWHYLVDVVAGLALTALSVAVARRILRLFRCAGAEEPTAQREQAAVTTA